jgi:hypothetical protein
MTPLDLVVVSLAAFYAAYAITRTHGPFNLFERARTGLPHGGLLACFYCATVWAALIALAALQTPLAPVVWAFAAAGGASFAYRWTGAEHT